MNVPAQAKGAIDKNVTAKVDTKGVAEGNESTIEVKTKEAEGTLTVLDEKNIFETHFRTSSYNTLSAKIDGLTMNTGSFRPLRSRVHSIYLTITDGERFSKAEINGDNNYLPSIRFTNELTNKPWYKDLIKPYIYENYPIKGYIKIKNRPVDPVGLPPLHTVRISQSLAGNLLTEADVQTGNFDTHIGAGAFKSYLLHYAAIDYVDLSAQVCANYFDSSNLDNKLQKLIVTPFPVVRPGKYSFKAKYVLPGINQITSSKLLTISINY